MRECVVLAETDQLNDVTNSMMEYVTLNMLNITYTISAATTAYVSAILVTCPVATLTVSTLTLI
jgi:hypothetical protein